MSARLQRLLAFGWPTALAGAACSGLVLANWLRLDLVAGAVAAGALLAAATTVRGTARLALAGGVLVLGGLIWGSARLDTLGRSVLAGMVGVSDEATVVVTGPAQRAGSVVRIPAEATRFGRLALHERVLLELPGERAPPQGAILELKARPAAPRGPETGFDERGWLARRGVHVVLRGGPPRTVGRRGGLGGVGDRLRAHVARSLARGAHGERLDLLDGIVLGDDARVGHDLKDDFRASGLYHLLAVSGQNVAFIVAGVLGLAWLAGIPRPPAQALVLVAIGAYALAVGWQPSVVRAAVAGCLGSLAWLASRPADRWHFLALGGVVLLGWSPATLFDPGFQLSFAAVAAIFLWVPWLERRLADLPLPLVLPRALRATVAVSVACGAATAPILWLDFERVPVWSVLANALAEPAVAPLLACGLLAALVEPVLPPAAVALSWLGGWAAAWVAGCARAIARLPGAQTASGTLLLLAALTLALGLVLARLPPWRRRVALTGVAVAIAVAGVGWWGLRSDSGWVAPAGLRVTFLDVGQGDAELLEVPQGAVLVDAGPPGARVAGQLARLGVRALSALVVTHPHLDHVGGAADVVRHVRVGEVLDPAEPGSWPAEDELRRAAARRRVPVVDARVGQSFRIGRLRVRVLWPDGGAVAGENPHRHGVVVLASYGDVDLLLPGDAESEVTGPLRPPPVEVLKVAHHGSADPGLEAELRRLRPQVAVIEVARGNVYGLPKDGTVAALQAVPGLRLFRTDVDGRVVLETDGRGIAVRTEREG